MRWSHAYWVGAIGAVDEDRSGFDLGLKLLSTGHVLGPDTGGKAIIAIVHEPHCFFVALDLHDGDNRAEGLVLHNVHVMVDSHEQSRGDVAASLGEITEAFVGRGQILSALLEGIFNLGIDGLDSGFGDDGAEGGRLVRRITELVSKDGLIRDEQHRGRDETDPSSSFCNSLMKAS